MDGMGYIYICITIQLTTTLFHDSFIIILQSDSNSTIVFLKL